MPVSREPLQITFYPFRENRLSAIVRVTDPSQPPTCRLAFLKEPRKDRLGNVRPICNLSIDLSEEVSAFERKNKIQVHSISRKEVNLSVVCVGDLIFLFFFCFSSCLMQNLKNGGASARLPGKFSVFSFRHSSSFLD